MFLHKRGDGCLFDVSTVDCNNTQLTLMTRGSTYVGNMTRCWSI